MSKDSFRMRHTCGDEVTYERPLGIHVEEFVDTIRLFKQRKCPMCRWYDDRPLINLNNPRKAE